MEIRLLGWRKDYKRRCNERMSLLILEQGNYVAMTLNYVDYFAWCHDSACNTHVVLFGLSWIMRYCQTVFRFIVLLCGYYEAMMISGHHFTTEADWRSTTVQSVMRYTTEFMIIFRVPIVNNLSIPSLLSSWQAVPHYYFKPVGCSYIHRMLLLQYAHSTCIASHQIFIISLLCRLVHFVCVCVQSFVIFSVAGACE